MKYVIFLLLCVVKLHALDAYLDVFHGFNNQFVLSIEQKVDVQESLGLGFDVFDSSVNNVSLNATLWSIFYRRYVNKTTSDGVF